MAPVVLAVVLTGCSGSTEPVDEAPGTAPLLSLGVFLEPASFDPATAGEGHYLPYYQTVYDSLIKREPDGSLSPMLATEWSYNDDQTELTLQLRDDVVFSDGEQFDAEVAKANLDHFPEANGPQVVQASYIESVEVTEPYEIVISLDAPDPALLISLTNALGLIASPAAIGTEEIKSVPVGSGPYLLDQAGTIVGSQYAFVRNEDYWGDALPYDAINFVLLTDETARLNALKSGQIDAAAFSQFTATEEIERAGLKAQLQAIDYAGFHFYDRDGVMNPALADVRVRQALLIAVDKEGLLENVLFGNGELTSQVFGPNSLAYDEQFDDYAPYAYDPDRARELLDEAGYAEGLSVELPISPAVSPAIYTTIEQNLADVGVSVSRVEYGPGQTVPALTGGKHSFAYMSLGQYNDWTIINQILVEGGTWNPLDTTDPEADEFISQYQLATTDEERQEAGRSLNEWLVENAWFGVFYRVSLTYGVNTTTDVELQVESVIPSIYNYSPAS